MYSDQWLGLPSALDIQPTKEEKIAKQQLDSLIAVGLISPDAARRSKKIAPSQRDQGAHLLQQSELSIGSVPPSILPG